MLIKQGLRASRREENLDNFAADLGSLNLSLLDGSSSLRTRQWQYAGRQEDHHIQCDSG